MAKRRKSVKSGKKAKGGTKCAAGYGKRKKKIGGRVRWVCVKIRLRRRKR